MLGIILLIAIVLVEIFFYGIKIWKKQSLRREKCILNLTELFVFLFLKLVKVIQFSFRWQVLFARLIATGVNAKRMLLEECNNKGKDIFEL